MDLTLLGCWVMLVAAAAGRYGPIEPVFTIGCLMCSAGLIRASLLTGGSDD